MLGDDRIGDAHCHLADLPDPAAAVKAAMAARVGPIVAVSMDAGDAERLLELRSRFPKMVRVAVGLHPSRVPELSEEEVHREIARIERLSERADGIGEIGLDYRDATTADLQRRQRDLLEAMLDLAAVRRLPVNLHTRRADRELFEIAVAFHRRTGLPANLHWFTHSKKLARRCGEEGLFISAGPSIEIDPRQAEVAAEIDPEYLLIETDSPVEYAGEPAQPAWARRVAETMASIRGEEPAALADRVAANIRRYLQPGV